MEAIVSEHHQRRPAIERLPNVLARTGLGRSTLYTLVAGGSFPAPIKLSVRAVGWRSDDVGAWLLGRSASR